jgi:hypothetical protein
MPLCVSRADGLPSSCIKVLLAWAGGEIGQTIGNAYRRQPAIQNLRLVPGDGLGKSRHTGGLRDGNPRRLLRHTLPGIRTVLGPDCPQAAHLIRQLTVRVSSFSDHQPAVMAITKWSLALGPLGDSLDDFIISYRSALARPTATADRGTGSR